MLDITSEHLLRDLAPQVLGVVIRRFHDFAAAEDAVQEALIAAAVQWPRQGVPDNPRAWLIQVALRRMTDHVRSQVARRQREAAAFRDIEQLVPPVDEMFRLFEDARNGGALFSQAIGWIQANYSPLSPTAHDIRHVFA